LDIVDLMEAFHRFLCFLSGFNVAFYCLFVNE